MSEKRNYTNDEVKAYNKKREQLLEFQKQKEIEYGTKVKEFETAITNLNTMLKEDGIDMVITEENIEECYKKLNDKKNADMEKGIAIMKKMQEMEKAEAQPAA